MSFSSWDGWLALVDTSLTGDLYSSGHNYEWFDPELMARKYNVRFAVDLEGKRIVAQDKFIGQRPDIEDPRKPYEKTTFKISSYLYGHRPIVGTFLKLKTFWVKLPFKGLNTAETSFVKRYFDKRGFVDVSNIKLIVRDWRIMLGMGFGEIQDKLHYSKGNSADELVVGILGRYAKDEAEAGKTWKGIKGVYGVTRQGNIKFVVEKQ
jgi:hypothetical protein